MMTKDQINGLTSSMGYREALRMAAKSGDPKLQSIDANFDTVTQGYKDWEKQVTARTILENYMKDAPTTPNEADRNATSFMSSSSSTPQPQDNGILSGLNTIITAPGDTLAGAVDYGIAGVANWLGLSGVSDYVKNNKDYQNLATNATNVLNNAPTYGTIIGAGVGAPTVGAMAGQAIKEVGHDIMGDNTNTPLQQVGNVGLSGIAGKIAGGGTGGVYNTLVRAAAGEGVMQLGQDVLGNNKLTPGQQLQSVATAGLLGAGVAGAGKVINSALEGAQTGGLSGALRGAATGAKNVGNEIMTPFEKPFKFFESAAVNTPNIDSTIDNTIDKAIRPANANKMTVSQTENYRANSRLAVKDIAANKDVLELTNPDGQVKPAGSVPENLSELTQANDQMLQATYDRFHALQKLATGRGVVIPTDPLVKTLKSFAEDKVIQTQYPAVATAAENAAVRYARLGSVSPDDLQRMVQSWNAELKAVQGSTNPSEISQATLTAALKNTADKALDDSISSSVADSASPGTSGLFTELKRRYAAQKAIQADVNRRLAVYARQNPQGLIDYTNIFSAGDAAKALASFNPSYAASALGMQAIKGWLKLQNDPNSMIKKMFQQVDSHISATAGTPILQQADAVLSKTPPTPSVGPTPDSPAPPVEQAAAPATAAPVTESVSKVTNVPSPKVKIPKKILADPMYQANQDLFAQLLAKGKTPQEIMTFLNDLPF